ncbi:MAG: signal peptidase I [Gaiellales bacterium]
MASLNELRKHPVIDLVITVVIAVGIAYLVQAFIVKPYRVPSGSMEPTISIGERIIASRFTLRFSDPQRNQIIVFHPNGVGADVYNTNSASSETFVKRLIGMPGETIGATGGHVYVCSGPGPAEGGSVKSTPGCTFLSQPFVSSPQDDFGPTKIPANRYFMMGDNRADSDDSRNWGPITKDQMIGVAFMSYWPPSRISIW